MTVSVMMSVKKATAEQVERQFKAVDVRVHQSRDEFKYINR